MLKVRVYQKNAISLNWQPEILIFEEILMIIYEILKF